MYTWHFSHTHDLHNGLWMFIFLLLLLFFKD